MERWRLMEEFENVAKNQPVFPGDTISHQGADALGEAGLIMRDENGGWTLSVSGWMVWMAWRQIPEKV